MPLYHPCVLEKILETPLDSKEIQPVHPKGNQSWIFTGRTEAEAPILWPPDEESQISGKDPDAGKDWGQEEKGATEDEVAGWHHRLNAHEFEQALRVGDGQGSLVCAVHGVTDSWTRLSNSYHLTKKFWPEGEAYWGTIFSPKVSLLPTVSVERIYTFYTLGFRIKACMWIRTCSYIYSFCEYEWSESRSVVSDSLQPHGLYSPCNSPGQNTGVGCHSLLQRIFPTQE